MVFPAGVPLTRSLIACPSWAASTRTILLRRSRNTNPATARFPTMRAIAEQPERQDMEDLAAYYESSYSGPAK